jgi:hypothetical protein
MGDEITTRGYVALTSTGCTTIMIVVLTITSGLGSFLDLWELVWFGYGSQRVWVRLVKL